MNFAYIYSTAILILLIMDPCGNLPVFIATLREVSPKRFVQIVIRESFIALAVMIMSICWGRHFLGITHIAPEVLRIAAGVIFLLMGIKMVFSFSSAPEVKVQRKEPCIVPLAIPMTCGPALIAVLTTIVGTTPEATLLNCTCSLLLAWIVHTIVVLCGRNILSLLGERTLDALESLMGLLITCIAVGMIFGGINDMYGLLPATK